jgi:hypothetical protein
MPGAHPPMICSDLSSIGLVVALTRLNLRGTVNSPARAFTCRNGQRHVPRTAVGCAGLPEAPSRPTILGPGGRRGHARAFFRNCDRGMPSRSRRPDGSDRCGAEAPLLASVRLRNAGNRVPPEGPGLPPPQAGAPCVQTRHRLARTRPARCGRLRQPALTRSELRPGRRTAGREALCHA